MPELPDVAGFEQVLRGSALDKPITAVQVRDKRILKQIKPDGFSQAIGKQRFVDTHRHGKLLFALLEKGGAIAFHFGMTGQLVAYSAGEEVPDHTRVLFRLSDDTELACVCRRMLGWVSLADDVDQFVADSKLGPDALDERLDDETFRQRLSRRRGVLKSTLMNQQVVAGVGNVWADEVLFQARLHPQTRVQDLSAEALSRLRRTMRRVLQVGARHGGDPAGLAKGYLLPYRSKGACPVCGGEIETISVGGRSTYYCPRCQQESSSAAAA